MSLKAGDLNKKIILHNFLIATVSYVLNILSLGIYGCIVISKSLFIVGLVMNIKSISAVLFSFMELCGILISCLVSDYIFINLNRKKLKMKKICFITTITLLTLLIVTVYIIARYIEVKFITNK